MTSPVRRSLAAFICAIVSALLVGPAHAAVVVEFLPASAAPGAHVEMNVIGLQAGDEVSFYLVPSQRVADALTGQDPPRGRFVIPVRRHSVERDGGITVDFNIPQIAPGRYVLVVHCRNCAGDGSTFSAVGDLEVLGSALPVTGRVPTGWLIIGSLLLLSGASLQGWTHSEGGRARAEEQRPRSKSRRSSSTGISG